MQQDWGIIFAFGLYFLALFGIGIFYKQNYRGKDFDESG